MNLAVVRALRRIKRLHVDRAEDEVRRRRAALAAATAAAAQCADELTAWREEMPRREAALYAAVIGQVVSPAELAGIRQRVVALREHEAALQARLVEAQKAVATADQALQAALRAAQEAKRKLGKFDDLVDGLQRAEALLGERREEGELEEFAGRDGPEDGVNAIAGGDDEWHQAV